jgi:Protein of unknown function (DUF3237)
MIDLEYEMTFAERIEGPLGPTTGSPARLCWKIAEATLARALASGRETTYAAQYMYMTPQFDVSHDTYDWLTHSLFIGRGRLAGPKRVEYELYRVR